MKKLCILVMIFLMVSVVSAETYGQDETVNFIHVIRTGGSPDDTILANFSLIDPDDILIIGFNQMTYNSINKTFNYTVDGSNHNKLGIYERCISATNGELNSTQCYEYSITPSGADRINSGEGISLLGGSLVMLLIAVLLFALSMKAENIVVKISSGSGAGIVLFIVLLFNTVAIQQNLGGFSNILSGYETFVFVAKIAISLGALILIIMTFLIMAKAWKVKRGYYD